MEKDVVGVSVRGVMPTSNGCAVFLGNDEKTFVIYMDQHIGNIISLAMEGGQRERPLTHDLIGHIFQGLEVELLHVIINHVDDGTFFARIFLKMENELGVKLVEIDARPSDSIVLALQLGRPLFVARKVLDAVEDMAEILERILKQQN